LRQLFGFVAAIAVLLAVGRVLWLAAERARMEGARVTDGVYAFKTVFALHSLADTDPHLPYATQRVDNSDPSSPALFSWRALVPPIFGEDPRTLDRTASWDSASNMRLRNCRGNILTQHSPADQQTQFLAITGPGTAFGDGTTVPWAIKDLPEDAILIVETRNSGLHWMEPGDFDLRTMPRTINARDGTGISGYYPYGFHVAFADGQYWCLSNEVPFETLEKFFTVGGAEQHDRDELLGPYRYRF